MTRLLDVYDRIKALCAQGYPVNVSAFALTDEAVTGGGNWTIGTGDHEQYPPVKPPTPDGADWGAVADVVAMEHSGSTTIAMSNLARAIIELREFRSALERKLSRITVTDE
jgi:hypothetical protein